jgi:hypothetical protein
MSRPKVAFRIYSNPFQSQKNPCSYLGFDSVHPSIPFHPYPVPLYPADQTICRVTNWERNASLQQTGRDRGTGVISRGSSKSPRFRERGRKVSWFDREKGPPGFLLAWHDGQGHHFVTGLMVYDLAGFGGICWDLVGFAGL